MMVVRCYLLCLMTLRPRRPPFAVDGPCQCCVFLTVENPIQNTGLPILDCYGMVTLVTLRSAGCIRL